MDINKNIPKKCPRCKHTFACNTEEGCWCEKIFIPREALKKIRQDYLDCLCKSCLEYYAILQN